MNTLVKAYRADEVIIFRFSWQSVLVGFLIFTLLITTLFIVYSKDLNRCLFVQYQSLERRAQAYQAMSNQLILKQGAWSSQARIQELAEKRLHMFIPSSRQIVFMKDERRVLSVNA